MKAKRSTLKNWWQASRYHFIPPSIFPVCIGAIISLVVDKSFSIFYFFLVLLAVVINHISLNMTDDYFDYKHAVDQYKGKDKNPYTGGSGTLTSGLIKPKKMLQAFSLLYLITITIGFFIVFQRGLPILIFGLIGIFSSIFYTAPPVKFSHYGLGEIGLLINFGTILGLGSYYVQSQTINLEVFLATLPCGIMLFSMIIINEIPDREDDKRAGKMTLVARYGVNVGYKLYIISWSVTFSVIVLGVIFKILPVLLLITLLVIPLIIRSILILKKFNFDPVKTAPANLDMIRSHSLVSILIISSYLALGILNEINQFYLLAFSLIFLLFYLPAGVKIFGIRKTQEKY